jgi:hypothetical protein
LEEFKFRAGSVHRYNLCGGGDTMAANAHLHTYFSKDVGSVATRVFMGACSGDTAYSIYPFKTIPRRCGSRNLVVVMVLAAAVPWHSPSRGWVARRWCRQPEVCWLGCKSPWYGVGGVLRRHVPTKNRKILGGDCVHGSLPYAMVRGSPHGGEPLVSKCPVCNWARA